jgi:2-polyprenyl-3-methyl-5-hydroxy-6-metoxy-1,4-benzoquinol methylase
MEAVHDAPGLPVMNSADTMYSEKLTGYFSIPRTDIFPLLPERVHRVLEVGCGSGATMRWIRTKRSVHHAIGIELFPEAARLAATAFDSVRSGNVETMSLPDGQFDLIIALDVLEHLVDPWLAVTRLQAMLSDDGAMLVSLPNISHYSVSMPLFFRGQWQYEKEGLLDRTHLRFFTKESALDMLTSGGLVVDKVKHVRSGPQFRSVKARWYVLKFLSWMLPSHLLDRQFLIRLRPPIPRDIAK